VWSKKFLKTFPPGVRLNSSKLSRINLADFDRRPSSW
jgi:hypothetical protein